MQLGFDVTSLIYKRGVSRYTSNLLRALNRVPSVRFSLYGTSLRKKALLASEISLLNLRSPSIHLESLPVSLTSKLWQSGLHGISGILPNIDIFHAWDWRLPPDKTIPLITTIHDLAMLRIPSTAHPSILRAHQVVWEQLKHRPIHVLAVSQTTRRDILELLELPPHRVHLAYEALPTEVVEIGRTLTEESSKLLVSQLGITKPFFLFVGTQEPRKNLNRVISAWQPFAKDYQLVVAGAAGWDQPSQSHPHNLHQPLFVGQVSDETLSALYEQAKLFLYPSLYEGFGLPILEAFHHGTPVVTSNNSGMAEIAGNAAELVDPLEEDSISSGITKILSEDLQAEMTRDQRMILRLQLFKWRITAEQTMDGYNKTIQEWQS